MLPQALGARPSTALPAGEVGPCIPLDLIIKVIRWGSLSLVDAFDVPLGGTCHETFTRGVMAPLAGVRVGGRLRFSYNEVVERLCDIFGHPHELVIHGGDRGPILPTGGAAEGPTP